MKNHTIAIDCGRYVPMGSVTSGIERIVDSFIRSFNHPEMTILAYTFGTEKTENVPSNIKIIRLPSAFFGTFSMPLMVLAQRPDVFVGFSGAVPPLLSGFAGRKIVFVYDNGFITKKEKYDNSERLIAQTKTALKLADEIVILAQTVRKQFEKAFPQLVAGKMCYISAGYDHLLHTKEIYPEKYEIKPPFFLSVGVVKPIKDTKKMIQLFGQFLEKNPGSPYQLIIAGPHDKEYIIEVVNSASYQSVKDNVCFIPDATDNNLVYLYKHAQAFLNTSREEGFCFPLGEAVSLGCPVIVTDLPLYHELEKSLPITIAHSDHDFIAQLGRVTARKKSVSLPAQFTWKSFTNALVNRFDL